MYLYFYLGVLELIILAVLLEKKVKILISIPLIAQLFLIILTVDGYIEIQLATVFFIVLIIVSCTLSISIIGFLYVAIKVMIEDRMPKIQKYGLLIIFLGFATLSFSLGVLAEFVIFGLEVWIGSIIALVFILFTIAFTLYNFKKGQLFLCDLELVKGDSLTVKKK